MITPHRLLWAWAFVFASAAPAAELSLEGSRLVVTGLIDGQAAQAFVDQLDSGKVRTVVLVDSYGGTAEAAESFARAIRQAGVNTEAVGQCYAACAWAFLAGKAHRFGGDLHANGLLIPASARPKPGETRTMMAGFIAATGTSPAPAAAAAADNSAPAGVEVVAMAAPAPEKIVWQPDQGVLFQAMPTLFGRVYKTFYCDGTQGRDLTRCEPLADADPFELGVLTR